MVAGRPAHRPQALVGLLPVRGDELGEGPQQPAILLVQTAAEALVEQSEVEDLAVDVDLMLAVRAVADPHRPAGAVALEVVEHALDQRRARRSMPYRTWIRGRVWRTARAR